MTLETGGVDRRPSRDSRPLTPAGRRRAQAAGFTLVEALLAMVILITGLVAISNLLVLAAASNSIANQHTAAATVAAERMEMLRARPFAQLAVGGGVDSDVASFSQDDAVPGVGIIHSRWQVTAVANDPSTLFIRVRAQGTGTLSGARSRAEFSTFRTCPVRAAPFNCP